MIEHLASGSDFPGHIHSHDLVLVDFYADWCEPCKWLDTILEEVDRSVEFPLSILKINTDKNSELTHEYSLRSVPVLMIFKGGILKWRMNGFLTTPELLTKLSSFHVKQV